MTFPPIETPFQLHEDVVHADWIDGNGHMNAWRYNTAFSQPMRKFFSMMGLGLEFTEGRGQGIFLLDCRIQYLGEVTEGMSLIFETQLIDHSDKVIHYLTCMLAGEERFAAATCEALEVQVDLKTRRSTPFSSELIRYLQEMLGAHAKLPLAESVGTVMGIRRKT